MELKSHAQGGVKPTNNTCTKGGLALDPESGWTGKAQANIRGCRSKKWKEAETTKIGQAGIGNGVEVLNKIRG